ncbi:response regulator transcription factor [Amycolatopsis thailandensis]|uniref:response regulator transcription factor n=1 Tax=Amycolatopsis thailandensis TaxID=589330 RepID=UPI0037949843
MALNIPTVLVVDDATRETVLADLAHVGVALAEVPRSDAVVGALGNIHVPKNELGKTLERTRLYWAANRTGSVPSTKSAPKVVLTARQRDVLELIAEGVPGPEIAHRLGVGVASVKTYKRLLFRKLEARDGAHAVLIGFRLGLLGGA